MLGALGRRAEAEEHHRSALKRLREGGQPRGVLQAAWDRVRSAPRAAEPAAPAAPAAQAAVLPPALSGRAHALPLVGRAPEMRVLSSLLDASAASLHALLVTGEPGAGKSRLLVELSEAVQRRGGTVLHAVAHEVERGRPYGPWIDASRQLPSGDALAFLFDERSSTEEEPTRERLFAGVAELLAASALAAPPVLLAFDDVQWLDAASATLLHYVARSCRERPVLVVLAARAGELPDNARVVEARAGAPPRAALRGAAPRTARRGGGRRARARGAARR
ncbi:MAG: ATP-binding protein [Sandaracinaceae bacterium]|nr:ATP-binding protein [Sandaracinaceae bacterium]